MEQKEVMELFQSKKTEMLDIYHSAHWKNEDLWKKNGSLWSSKCRGMLAYWAKKREFIP